MDVLPTRVIEVPDLDTPVRLHAIGDLHLMEAGCAVTKLRRGISRIVDDDLALVLLMGDLAGCIAPDDDKRWDPSSVTAEATIEDLNDWGGACIRMILRELESVKHRVVGVIEGNHESAYRRRKQQHITRAVASGLGAPAIGYSCLFTLRFLAGDQHRDLTIAATHGSSAATTIGGKANVLQRAMDIYDADLVLMGHVHVNLNFTNVRLHQAGDDIGERETLGVITGTYLRTHTLGHSGYGEQRLLRPVKLGHPVIQIVPSRLPVGISEATMVGWA